MNIYRTLLNIAFVMSVPLVLSCTSDGPDDNSGDGPEPVVGSTIMVSNEAGETKISMEFAADWTISNKSPWFVITPRSGEAGTRELTISTLTSNTGLEERVSSFDVSIAGDDVPVRYYVIQEATPGYSLPDNASIPTTDAASYTFTIGSNVKYEAVPDVDWLTVTSVEYDSTLLADNSTYSKYMTSRISVSVTANSGDIRTATISLNGADGETNSSIELLQMGRFVADYSRTFTRRSLALKFTETWCQNCPNMAQGLDDAVTGYPDHIVPIAIHSYEEGLRFPNAGAFQSLFGVSSYPSLYVNYYSEVENYTRPSVITNITDGLAREATNNLPSNTILGGLATVDGNTLNLSLYIASKEAGEYTLCVFLLEDGLVYPQVGAIEGQDYYHNDIARTTLTDYALGDQITLSANSIYERQFRLSMPSSVEDVDNIHVAAYVMRTGNYTGSVANAIYSDYGYVVDNAVDISINTIENFSYED